MTIHAFMAQLESRVLQEDDLAEGTVERLLIDLRQFAEWYEGTNGVPLTMEVIGSLSSLDLREFRSYLTQRKLAPSTIVRKFESLRKALKLLAPDRLAQIAWVKLPRVVQTSPSGFTTAQRRAIRRAIEKLGDRDAAICTLLLYTGARASSIASAQLSGLTTAERSGSITYEGKGRKTYCVPLNAEARAALKKWLSVRPPVAHDYIFTADRYPHARISRWVVHDLVHRRLASLLPPSMRGILHPHAFRHDLCRRLLTGDEGAGTPVPVADISAIAGHTSIKTVLSIYSRPSSADLERALDRISEDE